MFNGFWRRRIFPLYRCYSQLVTLQDGEVISLDWVVPYSTRNSSHSNKEYSQEVYPSLGIRYSLESTPILMIHHGAMGSSRDVPGQGYIAPALNRGWLVCVFNRRGHARRLTRSNFNFFGATEDVQTAIAAIRSLRPNALLLNIGLSVGSGLLVRYFGDRGIDNEFVAGVGVCPGYNIETCMDAVEEPYASLLLSSAKSFHLKKNKELLQSCGGYETCLEARSFQAFLDASYRMAGFESREDYYAATNPMRVARNIATPLLIINSEDGTYLKF